MVVTVQLHFPFHGKIHFPIFDPILIYLPDIHTTTTTTTRSSRTTIELL